MVDRFGYRVELCAIAAVSSELKTLVLSFGVLLLHSLFSLRFVARFLGNRGWSLLCIAAAFRKSIHKDYSHICPTSNYPRSNPR
jgi:hypothetical protein